MGARTASVAWLTARGFTVSPSLPLQRTAIEDLRPLHEIALRLMALDAVFTWVADAGPGATTVKVRAYAKRNKLETWMTTDERRIFRKDRRAARRAHVDQIGWKLENMWPLAWVLGLKPTPGLDGRMIRSSVRTTIMNELLPKLAETADVMLARAKPRSRAVVARLEDRFYCAHNAVRSAQLGRRTVPHGFDPFVAGRVIAERRHALTWCLSPSMPWAKTDLST
ncbi:MAG: DUF4272 domain-containing protein [Kofleriaceae bacterium]|nr:DUF4272 domain-containing protein [Kofleriaceae bacterium]